MNHQAISLRPFLGAKNYDLSRAFYLDLGFEENILSDDMSYFSNQRVGFYLQDAYVKDWVDNTMIFMEVEDLDGFWEDLMALNLQKKYDQVRLKPIQNLDWGRECFIHDPSGILWHIGTLNR